MISSPLAVIVVFAILLLVALRLERAHRVFASLGAALMAVAAAMILSNAGILPRESVTYDVLQGTGIDIGIVLILLAVDLRTVATVDARMVKAFALAVAGTVLGAVVGGFLLADLVGPETWKLAGQYAGTYSGGGVNFAAVGRAVGTSSTLFTAGIAADVIVTAVWLLICLAVPVLLGRGAHRTDAPGPAARAESADGDAPPVSLDRALFETGRAMDLVDTAALVALAFGVVWLADVLTGAVPVLPSVFWLTTLALVLAQVPAVQALPGGAMVGNYLVILFLVANGAMSVLGLIVETGPAVFYYAMTTVTIHGLFLFGAGRALRLDLPTLVVASQASIGGPPTAIALASTRGYGDRLLPGVVVGLLGYAGGNYLGLAVAAAMKAALGG